MGFLATIAGYKPDIISGEHVQSHVEATLVQNRYVSYTGLGGAGSLLAGIRKKL